jgi:hypothetical protein
MNKTLLIGITLNILGVVLMVTGILADPRIWPLIIIGLLVWVPAGYVILAGIWRI